jgi:hypothetical protein
VFLQGVWGRVLRPWQGVGVWELRMWRFEYTQWEMEWKMGNLIFCDRGYINMIHEEGTIQIPHVVIIYNLLLIL